jgi:osmotically-inducible protein OsmY
MGKGRKHRSGWVLVGLAALAGCDGQDADRLVRLGRKAVDRVQAADAQGSLNGPLEALHGNLSGLTADARVSARLRWDKDLAGLPIEVSPGTGGDVRLSGTVPTFEQRQRAVGLANATVGVRNVIDELTAAGERGP